MKTLIKNGTLIDDRKSFKSDILVEGNRIVDVSPAISISEGKVIDASGHYVAPGFIDVHNHGDIMVTRGYDGINLLTQGITTIVVGNCGVSALPVPGNNAILENTESRKWDKAEDYFSELESIGLPVNLGFLLGQGSVRYHVMGSSTAPADAAQLKAMRGVVSEYMDLGFLGVSSGLIYAPGIFTSKEEMTALLDGLLRDRIYTTHLRNEGPDVVNATREAIETAKSAGIGRLQLAHHKAAGRKNWGLTQQTVDMVDKTRQDGFDVGLEVYVYPGGHTSLNVVIPKSLYGKNGLDEDTLKSLLHDPKAEEISNRDGIQSWCQDTWDDAYITLSKNPVYTGRSVGSIARDMGMTPYQAAVTMLIDDPMIKCTLDNMMGEEDIRRILTHHTTIVASDGFIYDSKEPMACHPRNYGHMPRLLSSYVPDPLSLEDAVYKITRLPALGFGIKGRGSLAPGSYADIVVFSPDIKDRATVHDPTALSAGVEYLLINGKTAIDNGALTGTREGDIIRH